LDIGADEYTRTEAMWKAIEKEMEDGIRDSKKPKATLSIPPREAEEAEVIKKFVTEAKQAYKNKICAGSFVLREPCPWQNQPHFNAFSKKYYAQCASCHKNDEKMEEKLYDPSKKKCLIKNCDRKCGDWHKPEKADKPNNKDPARSRSKSREPTKERGQSKSRESTRNRSQLKTRDAEVAGSFQMSTESFNCIGLVWSKHDDTPQGSCNFAVVKGRVFFVKHFIKPDTDHLSFEFEGRFLDLPWVNNTMKTLLQHEADILSIDFNQLQGYFANLKNMGATREKPRQKVTLFIMKRNGQQSFVQGETGAYVNIANDPKSIYPMSRYMEYNCSSYPGDCSGIVVENSTHKVIGFNIGMYENGQNKFIPVGTLNNLNWNF